MLDGGSARSRGSFGLYCLVLLVPSFLSAQVITTVAGAPWVFQGNNRPATNAPIGQTAATVLDSSGNLYLADRSNHMVFRISPSGILTVVAGNGLCGFSGDGGPATSASLCTPEGLVFDAAGNLYIADRANNRIRRVSPAGTISVYAGTGRIGSEGDNGPALAATLNNPFGLAMDAAGNLFIAEYNSARIRKVSPSGIIVTFAGTGTPGFSGDGGPATSAHLSGPIGVAVDASGNLYIGEYNNRRVRQVNTAGNISTYAGGGSSTPNNVRATQAQLGLLAGVTTDANGNVFIADYNFHTVYRVDSAGIISTIAGAVNVPDFSGDGGPATSARLSGPAWVTVDAAGNLFISDQFNGRLRKVTASTGTIDTIAGNGSFKFSGDGGSARSANLNLSIEIPQSWAGLALDANGNLLFSDAGNNRIRKLAPDGTISTIAGTGVARFSGDGGAATNAALNSPAHLALDAQGNLYVADSRNFRIRRISPSGIISTVAGGGAPILADGGPATGVTLSTPSSVAVDSSGNLFIADTYNHRIRKVNPSGIISTVAGTTAGFSGDNGPATSAALNVPLDVAVDAVGNVFVADSDNCRIRRIDPNGIITTVAGSGTCGYSGDGGPATSAALNKPRGVSLDSAGSLYIADFNNRVRKVSGGVITTVAGNGNFATAIDGVLATNSAVRAPTDALVDTAGNLFIITTDDFVRKVLAMAPAFTVLPPTLSLTATAGSPTAFTQQVALNSAARLSWTAQATTQSGGNWLTLSAASGVMPATITVSANPATLAPGAYLGSIAVTAVGAPAVVTLPVMLTVSASNPASLQVQPGSLSFQVAASASLAASQALSITNAGGSTLAWTVQVATSSGGNWLSVAPSSGSNSAASTQSAQVSVNAANLAVGLYSGAVTIRSATTGQSVNVPVTLSVVGQTQTILVSQSGLLFTGVSGVASVPPQTIGILNTGQGAMSWTATASTLTGGSWLSATPGSGSSTANSLDVPLVQVQVNPSALAAGQYSGLIRISSSGANNSPQQVIVILDVLPAGSNPGVTVRPTGLIFTARSGGAAPGSQTVQVSTASAGSVDYLSGLLTFGGNWLQTVPDSGSLTATGPIRIVAQPSLDISAGSLGPGIYRGSLTLLFSDNSPTQVVDLLFVVVPPAATAELSAQRVGPFDTPGCTPRQLFAVSRTLAAAFSSPTGWPSSLEVQVTDDCGNAVPNAAVIASFSNGDAALALASLGNGTYTGTWRPVSAASQVAVTIRAQLAPLTAAQVALQGQVGTNAKVSPAVYPGGVVNAASFAKGDAVAPGSIVSVFGSNLAQGAGGALSVPLPTSLNGASLTIGGAAVPLFYSSSGQINAQVPFEQAANTRPQLVLSATNAFSVPETLTIAAVRPGIFTVNSSGTGQGAVTNPLGVIVDASAPAAAGEVVIVYCSGLGVTNPAVPSNSLPPAAEPLARATAAVTATVGGVDAPIQFAGLVPGFVGLYQVNVQIPSGVSGGSAVPLVLTQSGIASNTVTVAIR